MLSLQDVTAEGNRNTYPARTTQQLPHFLPAAGARDPVEAAAGAVPEARPHCTPRASLPLPGGRHGRAPRTAPRTGRGAGRGAGASPPGEWGCHQWEGWPGARFHRAAPRQPAASRCPRGGDERPAGPRPGVAGVGMRTLLSAATAQGRAPVAAGIRRAPGRAEESGPRREAGHRSPLQRPQRCLTPPAPGGRSRAGAVCRVSCTKRHPRSRLPPAPGRGAPRLCPRRGVPTAARPARPPAAAAGSAAPPGGLPPHPPAPGGYF